MRFLSSIIISSSAILMAVGCGTVQSEGDTAPDAGSTGTVDSGSPDKDSGQDVDAMAVDTTSPSIVTLSPADGSQAIHPNQLIVIEFSEPMDEASVEGAWESTLLPKADVSFSWNDLGTVLTAKPISELPVAKGFGLDPTTVTPLTIAIALDDTATDLAGNQLDSNLKLDFRTMRRMRADLTSISDLTRGMREDGVVFGANSTLACGDDFANLQTKIFMAYDVPDFPASSVVEAAELEARQSSTGGTPYSAMGPIHLFHVNAATLTLPAFSSSLSENGVFFVNDTAGVRSNNVTAEFGDDLSNRAARGNKTLFRMEFTSPTDSNNLPDTARFSRADLAMTVTYLAP